METPSGSASGPGAAARLFDTLGEQYEQAYGHLPERDEALDWLTARLPGGARILDVGSGTGRPTAERLVDAGFHVTGIDVSATMVEIASRHVPGAEFHQVGVHDFATEPRSWDAVCAFFSLLQLTRPQLDTALAKIATWVAPGGYLLLATVPADVEEQELIWMGHPIRATSHPTEGYVHRLTSAGLTVLHAQVTEYVPDYPGMGPEPQLFCYAHRPADGT
ncbi:class I SAM-dependent methyltransferase [Actinomadura harenae]|uniref:Class I SAM-dependent methyltransferase n=1 Tax=Actinomadura harenae TaxID=2483351 RepID=A0A3M2LPY3_9ACTN|nr:class I SAM-dependent methyltransferase [Actinomadura harenae]RMI38603.1 class I SAM-dependent methyltransferase [Actinomadura harenae]